MRYATIAAAVVVIGLILAASAVVYVSSEHNRDVRKQIDDDYDVDGYRKALEDNGLYPGDTPRLLPGSLGSPVEPLSEGVSYCMSSVGCDGSSVPDMASADVSS